PVLTPGAGLRALEQSSPDHRPRSSPKGKPIMKTQAINRNSPLVLGVAMLGSVLIIPVAVSLAQAPSQKEAGVAKKSPWQRVLQGDEARRAEALEKTVDELEKKGQFAEAIAPAGEVLAIRQRVQGEDHWETKVARIKIQTWARVAGLPRTDQSDL